MTDESKTLNVPLIHSVVVAVPHSPSETRRERRYFETHNEALALLRDPDGHAMGPVEIRYDGKFKPVTFQHLTAAKITRLAAIHGFEPTEELVVHLARQADRLQDVGQYTADQLLDGFLARAVREIEAARLELEEFERENGISPYGP